MNTNKPETVVFSPSDIASLKSARFLRQIITIGIQVEPEINLESGRISPGDDNYFPGAKQ